MMMTMTVMMTVDVGVTGTSVRQFPAAASVVRREQLAYVGRPVLLCGYHHRRRRRPVQPDDFHHVDVPRRLLPHLLSALPQPLPGESPTLRRWPRSRRRSDVHFRQSDDARRQRRRSDRILDVRPATHIVHDFASCLRQRSSSTAVWLHVAGKRTPGVICVAHFCFSFSSNSRFGGDKLKSANYWKYSVSSAIGPENVTT